jgi:tetratricopeptide (TPR) repeat protein
MNRLNRRNLAIVFVSLTLAAGAGWLWWQGRARRAVLAAEAALAAGDPSSALRWLKSVQPDPGDREKALLLKARAAVELGKPADSVESLNAVNPDGPFAADAAFWKGRALLAAKQTYQALNWFKLANQRRPNDPEILRWLAVAAYDQGAVPLALKALESVTRLRSDDARVWRTLAMIHSEYKRYDQACPAYEETLRLDPAQPAVRLEYADCLVATGAFDAAINQLEACSGSVDEARRSFLLASALRGKGDLDRFRAFVLERNDRFPNHAGLLSLRGALELHEGHPEAAMPWLDRAVNSDPWSPEHYHRRAIVLARLGRNEEAARDSRKASELNESIRQLAELDEQASLRPDDAALRCQLARLCSSVGKFGMAASWYRAALACDPGNVEARWELRQLPGQ